MAFLITLLKSDDPTWDTFGTSICSGVEMALALLAASVPGTHPILQRIFPTWFEDTNAISDRNTGHNNGGGHSSYRDARRPIALETIGGTKMTRKNALDSDSSRAMVLETDFEKGT